jgi:hypothetical protein
MAKTAAYVFGAILTVVGLWGFVQNPVLGIFDANTAHSVVHLVSGLLLLGAAMWWDSAWMLIVLGVVYAIVAVWGLLVPGNILGLIDNSTADNWLHVALAVVFLIVGFMGRGESEPMGTM